MVVMLSQTESGSRLAVGLPGDVGVMAPPVLPGEGERRKKGSHAHTYIQ